MRIFPGSSEFRFLKGRAKASHSCELRVISLTMVPSSYLATGEALEWKEASPLCFGFIPLSLRLSFVILVLPSIMRESSQSRSLRALWRLFRLTPLRIRIILFFASLRMPSSEAALICSFQS